MKWVRSGMDSSPFTTDTTIRFDHPTIFGSIQPKTQFQQHYSTSAHHETMVARTKKLSKAKRSALARQLSVIMEENSRDFSSELDMSEAYSRHSTSSSSSVDTASISSTSSVSEGRTRRKKQTKAPSSPLMEKLWSTHSELPLGNKDKRRSRRSIQRKLKPYITKAAAA